MGLSNIIFKPSEEKGKKFKFFCDIIGTFSSTTTNDPKRKEKIECFCKLLNNLATEKKSNIDFSFVTSNSYEEDIQVYFDEMSNAINSINSHKIKTTHHYCDDKIVSNDGQIIDTCPNNRIDIINQFINSPSIQDYNLILFADDLDMTCIVVEKILKNKANRKYDFKIFTPGKDVPKGLDGLAKLFYDCYPVVPPKVSPFPDKN